MIKDHYTGTETKKDLTFIMYKTMFTSLLLWAAIFQTAHASNRVALLIANENYSKSENDLKNPVNDAKLLSRKLKKLGYDVTIKIDSNRIAMHKAINAFGRKSRNAESAVFYYSGHGMQNGHHENFLIPVDAEITDEESINYTSVNVKNIITKLDKANPKVSLVMLDACRNNKFSRNKGSRDFGVVAYETDGEMLVSYATKAGEVADDGTIIDGNSPYALAVSRQLDKARNTPLLKMFDNVKKQVRKQTNNDQSPTTKGDTGYETLLLGGQASSDSLTETHTTSQTINKKDLKFKAEAKETSRNTSHGKGYQFSIFLNSKNEDVLNQIREITYNFNHDTFKNPIQKSKKRSNKFLVGYFGWGCLRNVLITVKLKNDKRYDFSFNMCQSIDW